MTDQLRNEIAKAVKDALSEVLQEPIDGAIDRYVQDYFDNKDCWLSFKEAGSSVSVMIGIGPADRENELGGVAVSYRPELDLDPYGDIGGPRSQEQLDDIIERIAAMKAFIAEIEAGCRELERQVDGYQRKQHKAGSG